MAYTGPTLTWTMSSLSVPATPADAQTVLTAISASVTATSTWEVRSEATGWIQLGTVAGSATPNQRVMIIRGATSNTCMSPDTTDADTLFIGIAPDGGTLIADPLGGATTTANMYGSDRFSGCWKMSEDIAEDSGHYIDQVFTISSAESIGIFLRNSAADDWWGAVAGAIIQPPDDLDGEGTPGRIYGMFTSGDANIATTFWTSATTFTGHSTYANQNHHGVFRPLSTGSFAAISRQDTGAGEVQPKQKTAGGTEVSTPVLIFENSGNGYYLLGFLRQMQKLQDHACRDIIQNGSSVDQVYCVSAGTNADSDALGFTQS